ncbi:hypothetical protein, partial [Sedimentibacter sp. B4]|uniref:hypothetical protein n=1 Tax=Sedimentibacter sp. B4 TaxID=304766 RepID=UPI001E55D6F1
MTWASTNGVPARFIDLPTTLSLAPEPEPEAPEQTAETADPQGTAPPGGGPHRAQRTPSPRNRRLRRPAPIRLHSWPAPPATTTRK